MNKTLKQLRILNPEVECYYIPHGRDKSQETKQIAIKNGFKYLKLNEAVESYLLTNKIYPYQKSTSSPRSKRTFARTYST